MKSKFHVKEVGKFGGAHTEQTTYEGTDIMYALEAMASGLLNMDNGWCESTILVITKDPPDEKAK